ncbi:MAG: hypothetical protein WBG38_01440 [Nodosilinea sp.]
MIDTIEAQAGSFAASMAATQDINGEALLSKKTPVGAKLITDHCW